MKANLLSCLAGACLAGAAAGSAASIPRVDWGAPPVSVTRSGDVWTIAGRHQSVTLDQRNLAISIRADGTAWDLLPAHRGGLELASADADDPKPQNGTEAEVSLADARFKRIVPYDTGARAGVKIQLRDWAALPASRHLTLTLTVALQGPDDELVFDCVADESHGAVVRRLDWPEALRPDEADDAVLSNERGILLPRDYPEAYNPIRDSDPNGTPDHKTEIQSNIIEDWSMSWWGFDRGPSSLMVIVETPDDAAYRFSHPAGGPTLIGPRWRECLGRLRYMRTLRFCFLPHGGYVAMARRYRQYAIDSGLFVSLREKVARSPLVARLIGAPMLRTRILTNIKPGSDDYRRLADKAAAYRLATFDERAALVRNLRREGVDRLTLIITGWGHHGYDRQHPDLLPPCPQAGGWDGMRRLEATCREVGYLFGLHDQYRDYYVDGPSFDPQFAVHEQNATEPAEAFPGSRFGDFKDGRVPMMDHWEGGKMAYLSPRFMLEHLEMNYQALFAHGIRPQGSYLDVFGYVPPDEDFDPEHPATRTDGRLARIACFNWCRSRLGFVGTEAGCDWTVPYVDFSAPEKERAGVPLPLFNLVYHDAIITPYDVHDLHGFLNAGLPSLSARQGAQSLDPATLALARRMAALEQRLAFVAMTNDVFLDPGRWRERTTFADGTTVTVDWDRRTVDIEPELKP